MGFAFSCEAHFYKKTCFANSWPIFRFLAGSALAQVTLDFGFGDEDFPNFWKFP
jgi:hypothetical protein